MAFRPSLRSLWTLIAMAVVCYGLYLWAEYSRVESRRPHYAEKLAAAKLMDQSMKHLAGVISAGDETLESYGDPRLDALIGQQFSTITVDIGSFESKLNGLNPNMAAAAVEILLAAGLTKGDEVAVALTGSNPGANLAMLAACQTLGVKANTICSVSSTWWGANNPNFTWVDMQTELAKAGLISAVPVAASLGGMDDNATGLSGTGRLELKAAAERNSLPLLTSSSADQAGRTWWAAFKTALKRQKYAAYINVGEGVASTGHAESGRLLDEGVHRGLPHVNWPGRGAMHLAATEGVPVIQFFDPTRIARNHGLGAPKIPPSDPGKGDVFTTTRYDVRVAAVALVIALGALFALVRIDAKYFRLADAGVDPETLL